uniref:TonB-dependent receptor n=1 Tax=Eiseniibacteriota bacterium TaxID=2212470 RepID=A0A832I325_UNCEI
MPAHRSVLALLALLTISLALPAAAQDRGTISGKVTDRRTGHAIPFASVTLPEARRGGLTDSEGHYQIPGVPAGTWELRIQFLGYKPVSQQVTVVAGRNSVQNFALEDIVVRQEKEVEVTAERRLVEVKQGATVRSVSQQEIRNLPVQTIGDVLQQQAGINTEADQIHVRGGRADETVFVVNGVANRDLVTGQSTAGQLNARSVAEVNVATGAFDVRYGNALSGVVEVRLREGGDRFEGGLTTTAGSYGGRSWQLVAGGPVRVVPGVKNLAAILDLSSSLYETRFRYLGDTSDRFVDHLFGRAFDRPDFRPLRSSYEDAFLGRTFRYGDFFSPAQDNRWAARLGLTWRPSPRDKWNLDLSKRIAIDQGFSRTFINAAGDLGDPAYPWRWARRIEHANTIFEDNVQASLEWRRTLGATGFTEAQVSRYFYAQRRDVLGKHWTEYEEPYDPALPDTAKHRDFFIDTGDDNTWQDRRTISTSVQWSLTQRFRPHEIELGFEHQFQDVQYVTIEDPWVADPDGLGGSHDLWKVRPWVGNVYLRDRLDYEGFTANFGVRADYWFIGREAERAIADTANRNVTAETRDEFFDGTSAFFGRRYKVKLSPRVIVAFPITQNSSFFFNYGQFTQNPSYRYVYSKLTSISSESFPLLGNPNLNPQVSVNYEVGAKHQFLPTAAVNASVFVKDVYDYPVATTFKRQSGTDLSDVLVYLNGHFARSKGFEIEIEKRRAKHWSGRLSYTYQQTKGKSSDPNEAKVIQEGGGDAAETRLSETFVRWNRPHKLTASLDLRFDRDAPARWLERTGLNLYVQGLSGRAFTPATRDFEQSAEPYSDNAPFQIVTDLRVNRWFRFAGRRVDVSLAGTNIFNNYVINRVDRQTGRGRVAGVGEYARSEYTSQGAYEYALQSEVDDPSNYGPGAQWRLSLDYDF